jgi:hypothetical protein
VKTSQNEDQGEDCLNVQSVGRLRLANCNFILYFVLCHVHQDLTQDIISLYRILHISCAMDFNGYFQKLSDTSLFLNSFCHPLIDSRSKITIPYAQITLSRPQLSIVSLHEHKFSLNDSISPLCPQTWFDSLKRLILFTVPLLHYSILITLPIISQCRR